MAATSCFGVCTHAFASPPSTSYRLIFADEFNGTSLDTSKWSAASPSWTMPNSDSVASANEVSVGNGVLTLNATRPTSTGSFSSGSISSYNKFNISSGYIEASIQLPSTPGSWPAFWGLYTGWPPEADIMEYPVTTNGGTSGLPNTSYNTNFHYVNSAGADAAGAGAVATGENLSLAYHTFGMSWVANTSVAFYLDGTEVSSYTGSAVSQMASMYTIFDYAVGGWPGTPSLSQWPVGFTDSMKVDWVRMWQTNPNSDATSNWNINGGGSFSTAGNWSLGVPQYGNEVATFGRVGTASTAAVTMGSWQMFGGISFTGVSTGTLSGTTAYTLGSTGNNIQLASTTGSVAVQAAATSTVNQTINANIELWSNTDFENNMTGAESININGNLTGNGGLSVDGVGSVVLSGSGSYSGNTTIGSAAGPAVLVANANNALSTGTVIIGTSGNGTTAKLELMGGYTLPNSINLNGRNNASVGIENLGGNNVLSGAISVNSGGGTYEIQSDAGTLTLSGGLLAGASGSRTITVQGAGNGLVTGPIQNGTGTVSLTMAGQGTWTLSGSNSFSGATSVSGGNLVLNNVGLPNTSGVSVSSGAELTVSGSESTGGAMSSSGTINLANGLAQTLTVGGGLTLSGATLNVDIGSSTSDRIAAGGTVGGGVSNTININPVLGQSMVSGNSYTIVTATGGLSAANFQIGTKPASLGFFQFGLSTPTATALLVNVSGKATPATAYWTGRGSVASGDNTDSWGAGASVGTSNWSTDSAGQSDALQLPGSITNVVFTGGNVTNTGVLTTQLDSAYPVNGITFNVPAASGTGATLLNTNGFGLTVGGGGVSIASASNSSAAISGTGSVLLSANQSWANNSATLSLNVSTSISALSGATTLTFNGTGAGGINLFGVLADGAGTLSTVFNQAGTTVLSASNTYSGTTTVASGTLQIGSTGQILSSSTIDGGATLMLNGGTNSIGASNSVTVLSGGTFDVRGASPGAAEATTIGSLNGGGFVTRGNSGLTTLSVGAGTFSGTIQDGGGQVALVKIGTGTLTLSGPSFFSGGTTISDGGGTLAVTASGALGTGSVTIGNGNSNQSGELQVSGGVSITSVPIINFESRNLSNAGGTADIENLSGANSISANLNINNSGGSSVNILSTAGTLTLNGNLSSTGLSSTRGFDFYGAGNGQVNGVISNGSAQTTFVQMDGPGTWTLAKNNTFTGGTTVNAGTLVFTGNNNFGGGGLTVNGGVVDLTANNTFSGTTTIDSGTVIMGSPSSLGSGTISFVNGGISGGGTLEVQTNGGDVPYNLNVSSGNEMTLVSDVLSGGVGINHTLGTLAIGRLATVYVLAGPDVVSGNPSITLGAVTFSSGVGAGTTTFYPTTASITLGSVTTSTNSAKTLDLDGTNTGNIVSGAISNGANVMTLVKSNTSTWTLAASSSFTGGTTINDGGGTLAITNGGALGTGSVTIGNGNTNQSGELQLSGGIAVSSVPSINFESRLLSNAGGTADIENLSGANSISANLNINNTGGSAVNVLSTAGTLTLSGSLSSTGLSSTRGFDFYGAGNGQVTGIISDGTVVPTFVQKDGTGTWTLTRNNTYSGPTTINGGTLVMNGNHVGGGAYTVASGATLAGIGTIAMSSSNAVTDAGTIAPGPGIGVLTIGSAATKNNVVFSGGGALSIQIGANGSSGKLAVNGAIDLSSTTDSLQLIGTANAFDGSTYTIATFTPSTLVGTNFSQVFLNGILTPANGSSGALGNGYGVIYDNTDGLIEVAPTPEPTSALLLAPLATMLRRRRRRSRG